MHTNFTSEFRPLAMQLSIFSHLIKEENIDQKKKISELYSADKITLVKGRLTAIDEKLALMATISPANIAQDLKMLQGNWKNFSNRLITSIKNEEVVKEELVASFKQVSALVQNIQMKSKEESNKLGSAVSLDTSKDIFPLLNDEAVKELLPKSLSREAFKFKKNNTILVQHVQTMIQRVLDGKYGKIIRENLLGNFDSMAGPQPFFHLLCLDLIQRGIPLKSVVNSRGIGFFRGFSEQEENALGNLLEECTNADFVAHFTDGTADFHDLLVNACKGVVADALNQKDSFARLSEIAQINHSPQGEHLFQTALRLTKKNPCKAEELAKFIFPDMQITICLRLIEILKVQDSDKFFGLLQELLTEPDGQDVVINLAQLIAEENFDLAINIASAFQLPKEKSRCIRKIMLHIIDVLPDLAYQKINDIVDPNIDVYKAFLAQQFVEIDFAKTLAVIETISEPRIVRDMIESLIPKKLLSFMDLNDALSTQRLLLSSTKIFETYKTAITNEGGAQSYRKLIETCLQSNASIEELVLAYIGYELKKTDPEKALELARSFKTPYLFFVQVAGAAQEIAKTDAPKAFAIMQELENNPETPPEGLVDWFQHFLERLAVRAPFSKEQITDHLTVLEKLRQIPGAYAQEALASCLYRLAVDVARIDFDYSFSLVSDIKQVSSQENEYSIEVIDYIASNLESGRYGEENKEKRRDALIQYLKKDFTVDECDKAFGHILKEFRNNPNSSDHAVIRRYLSEIIDEAERDSHLYAFAQRFASSTDESGYEYLSAIKNEEIRANGTIECIGSLAQVNFDRALVCCSQLPNFDQQNVCYSKALIALLQGEVSFLVGKVAVLKKTLPRDQFSEVMVKLFLEVIGDKTINKGKKNELVNSLLDEELKRYIQIISNVGQSQNCNHQTAQMPQEASNDEKDISLSDELTTASNDNQNPVANFHDENSVDMSDIAESDAASASASPGSSQDEVVDFNGYSRIVQFIDSGDE